MNAYRKPPSDVCVLQTGIRCSYRLWQAQPCTIYLYNDHARKCFTCILALAVASRQSLKRKSQGQPGIALQSRPQSHQGNMSLDQRSSISEGVVSNGGRVYSVCMTRRSCQTVNMESPSSLARKNLMTSSYFGRVKGR